MRFSISVLCYRKKKCCHIKELQAKLVIEPIFEADFEECSYGFRPKRSVTQAMEAIREAGNRGYNVVLDADIRDYFGSIDQGRRRW